MSRRKDILVVAGARPNFMKIAPVLRAMEPSKFLRGRLVHTGQHYDDAMSASFFRELAIPEPEENLSVGGGSHAQQTAEIMRRFEPVLEKVNPRAVLVVGDVNSTIACALVAAKKGFSIIHVEAGLRSFDRSMPEEINRVLTDQISDLLFTTEKEAAENLEREGIAADKIHFVGNTMVDTLEYNIKSAIPPMVTLSACGLEAKGISCYALLTMHRPSNVDDKAVLEGWLDVICGIARDIPVIFPIHPRTKEAVARFSLGSYLDCEGVIPIVPQSYLAMLGLMKNAQFVMTDSGGLQEETTALGVPCFTLRENTERWITVREGTNMIIGASPPALRTAYEDFINGKMKAGNRPALWDGRASERIIRILEESFAE